MIVDGRKVLYSMKGGVIQDPSIPTDGLVCYLDTRGKTNTDKHKETLLDLSGNGNHGTLQNFSFTEESGYVKNISWGNSGLRFDGVDDIILNYFAPKLSVYTIICNIENIISGVSECGFFGTNVFTLFYSSVSKRLEFRIVKNDGSLYWLGPINNLKSIIITCDGVNTTIKAGDFTTTKNDIKAEQDYIKIGQGSAGIFGACLFEKLIIYNRMLTEQEIQQLINLPDEDEPLPLVLNGGNLNKELPVFNIYNGGNLLNRDEKINRIIKG